MLENKADIHGKLYLLLLVLFFLITIYKVSSNSFCKPKTALEYSLLFLLGSCLASTLLSPSPKLSFDGSQGFEVGFFVIMCQIITIFILKDINIDKRISVVIKIVIVLILSLTIFDTMEIDILSLHKDVPYQNSYHRYISTIGNVDWAVGLFSLVFPYFIVSFIKKKTLFSLAICILSIFNVIVMDADGIILALGFSFLFIIPLVIDNQKNLKRFVLLLCILFIEIVLVVFLPCFNGYYQLVGGYSSYIYDYRFLIAILFLASILFFISNYFAEDEYTKIKKGLIKITYVFIVMAIILITIFVIKNSDSNFGTGRIIIWKESFRRFKDFNTIQKIFGLGPEYVVNVYSRLSTMEGAIYNTSHSEPIQMLLSTGIVGLCAWICCWISIFVMFIKNKTMSNLSKIGIYMSLFAYFAQSMVNSATVPNVCVLSLFAIMALNNKYTV